MTYRAPVAEMEFLLTHVLGFSQLCETERFAEVTAETAQVVLTEVARLAEDVLVPLNRVGDLNPAVLDNGVVRTSPGFKEAFAALADGGWIGINADPDYGGMGLSMTLLSCVGEIVAASNMALGLNPLLTQGQIEALEKHASAEIKALYLPKLASGQWTGTMNLTEPQAGTDVGALRSRAVARGDGTYAISGQKIFITWGDHDVAENICHLVLARLPESLAGTKGISLFIVPKFLPDDTGNPGAANELRAISLEHKMGVHGSPTAVMDFDGATGWLVGVENGGMAAMFTMMNNARVSVGVQGVGIAEAAYQKALKFARERKQGRTPTGDGQGAIIDHADVRRMLLTMRTRTLAARALCLDTSISLDMAQATGLQHWADRAAFLTPMAKAFGSDVGCEVADLGLQVHGGMGFIEETGAAQLYRDVRITPIYEGTNGIQAMDLVARKLADGGVMAQTILAEVAEVFLTLSAQRPALAETLAEAHKQVSAATDWMLAQSDLNDRFAGSVPYLRAFSILLGAKYLAQAAAAEPVTADRVALLEVYICYEISQVSGLCKAACCGAQLLYSADEETLFGQDT